MRVFAINLELGRCVAGDGASSQETVPAIRVWKAATISRRLFQLRHEYEWSHARPCHSLRAILGITFDGSDMYQVREAQ